MIPDRELYVYIYIHIFLEIPKPYASGGGVLESAAGVAFLRFRASFLPWIPKLAPLGLGEPFQEIPKLVESPY